MHQVQIWMLVCAWTAVIVASLVWNLLQNASEIRSLTFETARALLEKDLMYREWSILHGRVYVPASAESESPDASRDQGREILTAAGEKLTLLNPAIVSRQIFELQDQQLGIRGHITSLKPVVARNSPDAWERDALQKFEKGVKEASSTELRNGERYFRMMRPLITVPACLACHEEAGRVPGQIRGGISVSVPLRRFAAHSAARSLVTGHCGLWLAGLVGLGLGARSVQKHARALQRAENERERLISELRDALASVKTLSGLLPICSSCKKIRDEKGNWTQLESYIKQHTQAEFSHGLCLDCLRRDYPEVSKSVEARLSKSEPNSP